MVAEIDLSQLPLAVRRCEQEEGQEKQERSHNLVRILAGSRKWWSCEAWALLAVIRRQLKQFQESASLEATISTESWSTEPEERRCPSENK